MAHKAALAVAVCVGVLGLASPGQARTIFGLTSTNTLIRFDSAAPGTIIGGAVVITGLQGGENLLAIDFRPATGQLYGIGSTSRLYTINTTTGVATQVGSAGAFTLSGTSFGGDFNPVPDRIRVVSDADQNIRLNPNDGSLSGLDTNLAYDAADTNNGQNPNVVGVAYTNNVAGAASTTLYGIDSNLDVLVRIGGVSGAPPSPNAGTLFTLGPLGVNTSDAVGLDISPEGNAFASLNVGGVPQLYSILLGTGAASLIGMIGTGATPIVDIAVDVSPPCLTASIIGLTSGNSLVRFNSNAPGTILSTLTVTGLQGGENLLGIDFRPATGQLYGIGGTSRLYVIDTTTGAATQVGSAGAFALSGTSFGTDFNPVVDRIRVVSDADQNIRVNPNDGTLSGTDTNLAYDAADPNNGQNPNVVGAAYTNNVAGAGVTTLYGVDSGLDVLVRIGGLNGASPSPNAGVLFTVGPLGVDTSSSVGLDISVQGTAFASLTVGGTSQLYTISLGTGAATLVGAIGVTPIVDIAAEPCGLACGGHSVHGHVSTAPPSHSGNVSHEHHGQHNHSVTTVCVPHVPGHSAALIDDVAEPQFLPLVEGDQARRGGVLRLFGSALGLFLGDDARWSAYSFTAPVEALYFTTSVPEVRVGGRRAEVLFSGLAPGLTGGWQIDLRIPADAPEGTVPVTVFYEGKELRASDVVVK